jgi:PhzF family phenazine biosynthesis protein
MSVTIPIHQVDAFTDRRFTGNPAAVCPLEEWLDDDTMQAIAAENNLSETAFFVPAGGAYELRWFTPVQEVDLCGHATLASAFVVFDVIDPLASEVTFLSKSGKLHVRREETGLLSMRFPRREPTPCDAPAKLLEAVGMPPREVHRARDYMAVYGSESEVRDLEPAMPALMQLDTLGLIVTAPGEQVDFVSRFFAPRAGVDEDPVTGSAHCTLVPYWSRRLGKATLRARQISRRGGELFCEDAGETIVIAGRAVAYLRGTIAI